MIMNNMQVCSNVRVFQMSGRKERLRNGVQGTSSSSSLQSFKYVSWKGSATNSFSSSSWLNLQLVLTKVYRSSDFSDLHK